MSNYKTLSQKLSLQWAVLKQTILLIRQLHKMHLKQSFTVDQPVYVGEWLLHVVAQKKSAEGAV